MNGFPWENLHWKPWKFHAVAEAYGIRGAAPQVEERRTFLCLELVAHQTPWHLRHEPRLVGMGQAIPQRPQI